MLVSVLMPVFNCESYVTDALQSILEQTYDDLEIIIVNDGSTDDSVDVIKRIADKRIRLYQNISNAGLVKTLNFGISQCRGHLIARMDADDVSCRDRIEKQVTYFGAHSECICVGTWYTILGTEQTIELPTGTDAIRICMWEYSPMCHPSTMMKREALSSLHYEEAFRHAEDYKLWSDLSELGELHNIPEPLLRYRIHNKQIAHTHKAAQVEASDQVRLLQLRRLVPDADERQQKLHLRIMKGSNDLQSEAAVGWISSLIHRNYLLKVMPEPGFTHFLVAKLVQSVGADGRTGLKDLIFRRLKRKLRPAQFT